MTKRVRVCFPHRALLAWLLLLAGTMAANAGILGSKHDFSARGWGSNEICVFCHAPHNNAAAVPLWNRQLTTATYTLYSSPTLQRAPMQPRAPSKLCLSCHDGTVAIDSFGGRSGGQTISGPANLGTDLANDHPTSVYWDHQTLGAGTPSCFNCHFAARNLPFFNRHMECASCHEPHNSTVAAKMLRKTLDGSAICFHCHGM